MFTTIRYFYPNGIEGESMDNTIKEHSTFEKALNYAHRYSKGIKFAGVEIEDEKGKKLYEITSDGNIFDYR